MTRAISIVLIATIVLQSVGCSSWRPLTRANEVTKDSKETSMRDQVLGKLSEGMVVRIEIREGSRAPIKRRIIECLIKEIGHTALTVTPVSSFSRGIEITLRYADIVSIEHRESGRAWAFFIGAGVGVLLGLILIGWGLSGIELD